MWRACFVLPERAPSEGPRSTAAVESSSHPWLGDELWESTHATHTVEDALVFVESCIMGALTGQEETISVQQSFAGLRVLDVMRTLL